MFILSSTCIQDAFNCCYHHFIGLFTPLRHFRHGLFVFDKVYFHFRLNSNSKSYCPSCSYNGAVCMAYYIRPHWLLAEMRLHSCSLSDISWKQNLTANSLCFSPYKLTASLFLCNDAWALGIDVCSRCIGWDWETHALFFPLQFNWLWFSAMIPSVVKRNLNTRPRAMVN